MKLLLMSGSLRAASLNKKLLAEAARIFDADETIWGDLDLPLYNGDLEEQGMPETVQKLADQIANADAVVMASPEYNQSMSGVIKNALDWISRTKGSPWAQKPVALIHAAGGRAGGARANYALRLAMAPFDTQLLQGPEVLVAGASNEFDEDGHLTNEHYIKNLTTLMARLKSLAS